MNMKSYISKFLLASAFVLTFTGVVTAMAAVNLPPTIILKGAATIEIMKGESFVDKGATCTDPEEGIVTLSIDQGGYNNNVAGVYTLTYTCTDEGEATASTTRVVTVKNNLPTITLKGDAEVETMKGETFVDKGATCTDIEDGIVILSIDQGGYNINTAGVYTLTYTCTDEDGGTATTTRKVTVKNNLPTATLKGSATLEINQGADFVDKGATCTDVEDGVVTLSIDKGGYNKDVAGTYTLTYTCTDEDMGTATTTRQITVKAPVVSGGGGGGGSIIINNPTTPVAPTPAPTPVVTLPAPVGQVLGAETSSCAAGLHLTKFLRRGYKNDKEQVKILQKFLNDHEGATIKVDGNFGYITEQAVKKFQKKYAAQVLAPWGIKAPTGIFYITTQMMVNNIICPDSTFVVPGLVQFSDNPASPTK